MRFVALYSLFEAWRSPFPVLVALSLGATFAVAGIAEETALTERAATRIALQGAMLRVCAVLNLVLFVVTSVVREGNERVVEALFSQPCPRSDYYFGKLIASAALAGGIALLCACGVLLHAPLRAVLLWTASLALELWMVAAAGLLCVLAFRHAASALLAVLAFYVLGRTIGALRLMSESPLTTSPGWSEDLVDALVALLHAILPDLGRYASSDWLVHPPHSVGELPALAVQAVVWVALLSGAALFDLYRRNL